MADLDPDELDVLDRGLVAVAYELEDGMLTLTVSQSRVCDLAALRRVRRRGREPDLRERLDNWREVHVARGANVSDELRRVLAR